jgi:hypothetical protein
MQLTPMPVGFKFVLVAAAIIGFGVSMAGEQRLFPRLARLLGLGKKGGGNGKKRKAYKIMGEKMRF